MKNLLHSLGRRQRADKKEECLPRGSAGEKQNRFFPFLCNVKMVGEEIIKLGKREGSRGRRGKKQQLKENRLERRKDQCIYTIHLWQSSSGLINLMFLSTFCPEGNMQFVILLFLDLKWRWRRRWWRRIIKSPSSSSPLPDRPPPLGVIKWNNQF